MTPIELDHERIDRAYRIVSTLMQAEHDRKAWDEFHANVNQRLNAAVGEWFNDRFRR